MNAKAQELLALLQKGESEPAGSAFQAALAAGELPEPELGNFLIAAEEAGQGKTVSRWLDKVLTGSRSSSDLLRGAIRFYQHQFDWARALTLSEQWRPGDWREVVARHLFRANSLVRLLRAEEAIAELDAVERWPSELHELNGLRVRADALAQLDDHQGVVSLLSSRLESLGGIDGVATLWKSLGRALDRLGEHDSAWQALEEGSRLQRQQEGDTLASNAFRQQLEVWHGTCTPEWFRRWKPVAPAERTPVFLVGFPRSGTTLLEQMLDAHPAIRALEEKPGVDHARLAAYQLCHIRTRMAGRLHPNMGWKEQGVQVCREMARLGDKEIANLRKIYFDKMAEYDPEWAEAEVFIDKQPLNLISMPFIYRLFPGARFIVALRHPCDCVLSCYMQHFARNEAMANMQDIEKAAIFYRQVMRLLRKTEQGLGLGADQLTYVRYEDLLTDFRGEIQRLLSFLGLEWDPAVERFYEHARERGTLSTPSYAGVTRELYHSASGRWRHYAHHLGAVTPHLEEACERFGYGLVEAGVSV